MDRRDFLAGLLSALFLALFPWLRTEQGAQVAADTAYGMLHDPLNYESLSRILKERYPESVWTSLHYGKSPFLAAMPKAA